jgi:hypothetical protein
MKIVIVYTSSAQKLGIVPLVSHGNIKNALDVAATAVAVARVRGTRAA